MTKWLLGLFAMLLLAPMIEAGGERADKDGIFGMNEIAIPMQPGQSYRWTFEEPGDFPYHCRPHESMTGRVIVVASEGAAPTTHFVDIIDGGNEHALGELGYRNEGPRNAGINQGADGRTITRIAAGDTIVWTNAGTLSHNVESEVPPPAEPSESAPTAGPAAIFAVLAGLFVKCRTHNR